MSHNKTKRRSRRSFPLLLAVLSVTALSLSAGAGSAFALWSDYGTSQTFLIEDAPVMARVGLITSSGEPTTPVSYDGTTRNFWVAPLNNVPGEYTQETGLAGWEVPVHAYNPIQSAHGKSTMSLGVSAKPESPWSKAKFTLTQGSCASLGGVPDNLDSGKLLNQETHSVFLETVSNMNSDDDSLYCLWAKLPPEESKEYTVDSNGNPSTSMTGDLLSEENKSESKAGYTNTVTVQGEGLASQTHVEDSDKWTVHFKRFPNPKQGDVSLLFRPESTTGICE